MIQAIYKGDKNIGYATVGYSSSDAEEIVVEMDEKEIEELSGLPWREGIRGLRIGQLPDEDKHGRSPVPGPGEDEPPGRSRAVERSQVEIWCDKELLEEE